MANAKFLFLGETQRNNPGRQNRLREIPRCFSVKFLGVSPRKVITLICRSKSVSRSFSEDFKKISTCMIIFEENINQLKFKFLQVCNLRMLRICLDGFSSTFNVLFTLKFIMSFVTCVAFHTIYDYQIFEQQHGYETHLISKGVIKDLHLEHRPFRQRMKLPNLQ